MLTYKTLIQGCIKITLKNIYLCSQKWFWRVTEGTVAQCMTCNPYPRCITVNRFSPPPLLTICVGGNTQGLIHCKWALSTIWRDCFVMQSVAHTSAEGSAVILGTNRLTERCGFCSRGFSTLQWPVAELIIPLRSKKTNPLFPFGSI